MLRAIRGYLGKRFGASPTSRGEGAEEPEMDLTWVNTKYPAQ